MDNLAVALASKNTNTIEENLLLLDKNLSLDISHKNIVKELLNINNTNVNIISAELIAEWAKETSNREVLSDKSIVNILLKWTCSKNNNLIINSARGLANICYENETAANFVDEQNLQNILEKINPDNKECNEITAKLLGMLTNILNLNNALAKYAIKNNLMDKIELVLAKNKHLLKENENIITLTLSLVIVLSDYYTELNLSFSENFYESLIYIFKTCENLEIGVKCLDICHGQSERDEVLLLFAEKGVFKLLYELVEKYKCKVNDEETRSVLNMACDLLVTILTKDESMNLIYDNGKGKMYSNMIGWLDSDDSDLLCSGIMALGNFARNEKNCIQMVESGLSKKLIDLLSRYNSKDSDMKIQHAILSTLKNLAIPPTNKLKLLNEGLMNVAYPIIETDQYLVIFKLLGTLRMVVNGQETAALNLVSNTEFLNKTVYWYKNSDHLGVRVEVPRLISWLIKSCHSFKPIPSVLTVDDCLLPVVEMISSNFEMMQNEAFYALHLLCSGALKLEEEKLKVLLNENKNEDLQDNLVEKFFTALIKGDIGKHIILFVTNYSDKINKETMENLVTLLELILESDQIKKHLNEANLEESLKKLSLTSHNENLSRVENVIKLFNKSP